MPKENLLTRDLYRQIKSMDRSAMEKTLNNIYEMGAKDALDNAVIDLDIGKIRSEIGAVNGIGERRLEHIMEISKRIIKETAEKGEASTFTELSAPGSYLLARIFSFEIFKQHTRYILIMMGFIELVCEVGFVC